MNPLDFGLRNMLFAYFSQLQSRRDNDRPGNKACILMITVADCIPLLNVQWTSGD